MVRKKVKFAKVDVLPAGPDLLPDALYFIRPEGSAVARLYITTDPPRPALPTALPVESDLHLEGIQDAVAAMLQAGSGITLAYNDITGKLTLSASGGGGGGSSAPTRQTASVTTSVLPTGASEDVTLALAPGYLLQRLTSSHPAWARLYLSTEDRTADASRPQTEDPEPGAGVVAELIGTVARWPGAPGWDDKPVPDGVIAVRVTNLSGAARALTLTAQFLPTEAQP